MNARIAGIGLLLIAAISAGAQVGEPEAAALPNASLAQRISLSQTYIDAGDLHAATGLLHQITTSDPASVVAWNNLCVTETLERDLDEAADACRRAVTLAPDFTLARNNLAWEEATTREEQQALADQEAVAPSRRDRDFYLAQGLHHLHLGHYDAAIRCWEKMLLLNSQDAMAANNIGTALMFKHRTQEARTWFEKAASWDPSLQIARNNLAWAASEEAPTQRR